MAQAGSYSKVTSGFCSEVAVEDDDALGYYEDGVKRTLTNEQVAIFRHSEIQTILRSHRHRQERKSLCFETVPRGQQLEDGAWGVQEAERDEESPLYKLGIEDESGDEEGEIVDEDDDDEEEYERFLEAERREMELAAAEQRKKSRDFRVDESRKTSTRRKVRELDAVVVENEVLDYGDDLPTVAETPDESSTTHSDQLGRKIWWPEIAISK